jgi:hypothetical protein
MRALTTLGILIGAMSVLLTSTAHAGFLSQNREICGIYTDMPDKPDRANVASCLASDDGIDLSLTDGRLGNMTPDRIQIYADYMCKILLQSIVDNIHPKTFTMKVSFENGTHSSCSH